MDFPAWHEAWCAVVNKCHEDGYATLSPAEQVWFNMRSLIDMTENGGLISYYCNSGADTVEDCMEALDMLEAPREIRDHMERVNALFGEFVPECGDARNEIISDWPDGDEEIDAILSEADEVLMPLMPELGEKLETYLRRQGLL